MTAALKRVQLTLLSTILGSDFPRALEYQRAVGIRFLDLKDGLWGKTVEQLNDDESARTAELIREFGMETHCFSTSIGHTPLKTGTRESDFRAQHEPALDNCLRVAKVLHPQIIRLLAPQLSSEPGEIAAERMLREFPWIVDVYREWVDRIAAADFGVLIENEAWNCLLSSVADVQVFFAALDRPATRYIWDVQNLWQTGTFPTMQVYRDLQPLIGAVHLKGGRVGDDGKTLTWAAPLDEASWPVLEIVRAVVADGVAPYICLNPSHGRKPPEWNAWDVAQHEIAFLRREVPEIV